VKAKAGAVDGGWTEEIKSSSQITAMFGTSVFRVGCGQQNQEWTRFKQRQIQKRLLRLDRLVKIQ